MTHLALRLLGGFEVRVTSKSSVDFPTKKGKALLAYVARHPGQRISRDKLATLLWGNSDDAHAGVSLRQTLRLLRKSLGHAACPCVISDGDALYLDRDQVEVDVAAFDALCGEQSPDALEQAAALYRGQFLEGFALHEEPYEEWLRAERASLQERAIEALMALVRWHLDAGNAEQGVRVARKALSLDPLRETAHRALMRLYADLGDRSLALKQYQSCCDILNAELGVEPDAETRRLHEEIRHEHRAIRLDADALEEERSGAPPLPDKPSIAVLPFLNIER